MAEANDRTVAEQKGMRFVVLVAWGDLETEVLPALAMEEPDQEKEALPLILTEVNSNFESRG